MQVWYTQDFQMHVHARPREALVTTLDVEQGFLPRGGGSQVARMTMVSCTGLNFA